VLELLDLYFRKNDKLYEMTKTRGI